MATLVYSDVDGVDRSFALGAEPVTVGRGAECAIRSEDPRVSRLHARFFVDQGALWIEDLGSSNGIFVGPNKVSRALVPTGEVIVVGSLLMRLLPASGTLPPPIGLHGTLASWLELERKARAAVEDERDAFARRVGEMHHQLAAVVSARTMDPDAPELVRQAEDRAAAAERALADSHDELASAHEKIAELAASVGDSAYWSGGDAGETARMKAGDGRMQAALDEAERARSIAEHAHGEAMREAQGMRDELVAHKKASALELEAMRVELAKARESGMIADAAAGVAVAEKLAAADGVIAGLTRELADARAARPRSPTGPDPRIQELSERMAVVSARADKAEKELAATQIRAQGNERNLSGANAAKAAAEQTVRDAERRADDAEKRASAADTMAKAMAKDVAEALRRASDADSKARGVGRELTEALRRAEQAETRTSAGAASARELETRAVAADERVGKLEQELAAERATAVTAGEHSAKLAAELAEAQGRLPAMQQRAEAAEHAAAQAETRLAAQQARLEDLENGLSVAEANRAGLDEARVALRSQQTAAAEARAAADQADQLVEHQRAQLAELEAKLRDAEQASAAAEAALHGARQQIAGLEHAATEQAGISDTDRDRVAEALAHAAEAERKLESLSSRAEAADLAIGKAGALQRQLDEALTRLAWLEREQAGRGRDIRPPSEPAAGEQLVAAETRARDAEARVAEAEGQADAARVRGDQLAGELAEAERQAAAAAHAGAEADARIAQAEQRVAVADQRAHAAEAQIEQLTGLRARIAELEREVANADNVRSFAAETEREIAGLQRDLRDTRGKLSQITSDRDRLAAELRNARGDSDTTSKHAPVKPSYDPEATAQADVGQYESLIAKATELERKLARLELEDGILRRKLAETEGQLRSAEDRLRAGIEVVDDADPSDHERTRTGSQLPPVAALAEHINTLQESIDSLRANMRAASDETAMMDPSESVTTISTAVSHAAEHVEVARAAIKALAASIGVS